MNLLQKANSSLFKNKFFILRIYLSANIMSLREMIQIEIRYM